MTPAAHVLGTDHYAHRAVPPGRCEDDYLEWYYARSHIRIQNPEHADIQDEDVQHHGDPNPLTAIVNLASTLYHVIPQYHTPEYMNAVPREEFINALYQAGELLDHQIRQLRLNEVEESNEGEDGRRRRRRRGSQ